MIRVLIADDQEIMRAGLAVVLDAGEETTIVGQAADGAEAVELAARLRPDVVCMDIRMPGLNGIEATRAILATPGNVSAVLIVTTFDLDEYVFGALEAGAAGFVLKGAESDALRAAVRSVAAGEGTLDQQVTRRVIAELGRRNPLPAEVATRMPALTDRENEIVVLLAEGLSNQEIAARLFIEPSTVKYHVASILTKTGLRDRLQVVVWAFRNGLAH
ncbi:response regulator transcription factor [Humibacter antri]